MADANTNPQDDPGWPRGMSAMTLLIPGVLQRRARQSGDGLLLLRQVTESFTFAIVLFGLVLVFLNTKADQLPRWFAILVVVAIASVLASRTTNRPLDCSSLPLLAGTYKVRFFLRVAFAEAVAMFGFVFAFIGGGVGVYLVGAVFALGRLWSGIAPTRGVLAQEQRELYETGCTLNLIEALRTTPPPASR